MLSVRGIPLHPRLVPDIPIRGICGIPIRPRPPPATEALKAHDEAREEEDDGSGNGHPNGIAPGRGGGGMVVHLAADDGEEDEVDDHGGEGDDEGEEGDEGGEDEA